MNLALATRPLYSMFPFSVVKFSSKQESLLDELLGDNLSSIKQLFELLCTLSVSICSYILLQQSGVVDIQMKRIPPYFKWLKNVPPGRWDNTGFAYPLDGEKMSQTICIVINKCKTSAVSQWRCFLKVDAIMEGVSKMALAFQSLLYGNEQMFCIFLLSMLPLLKGAIIHQTEYVLMFQSYFHTNSGNIILHYSFFTK